MADSGRLLQALRARLGGASCLDLAAARDLARDLALPPLEVELAALERGIWPCRLLRHQGLFSPGEQGILLRARVGVMGCGGLGGLLADMLARLGVGELVLVDPDRFEEHNLNRQVHCTVHALGRVKAEVARDRVLAISPWSRVKAVTRPFQQVPDQVFQDLDLVLDALDSAAARQDLARLCARLDLPLVHGAVSRLHGQAASLRRPGPEEMARLCPPGSASPSAVAAPAVHATAALQVAMALGLLLGGGQGTWEALSGYLFLDLAAGELHGGVP